MYDSESDRPRPDKIFQIRFKIFFTGYIVKWRSKGPTSCVCWDRRAGQHRVSALAVGNDLVGPSTAAGVYLNKMDTGEGAYLEERNIGRSALCGISCLQNFGLLDPLQAHDEDAPPK